jgi:hypothetical protein
VNAGQNPPILSSSGRSTFLESTGIPLGLVRESPFAISCSVAEWQGVWWVVTNLQLRLLKTRCTLIATLLVLVGLSLGLHMLIFR